MAEINSETVYNVQLSEEELQRLQSGGDVSLDLPTGDVMRLTSEGGATTVTSDTEESVTKTDNDDVSPEDIEELVREGEQNAKEVEGNPVDEGNQGGNQQGMISIERGASDE